MVENLHTITGCKRSFVDFIKNSQMNGCAPSGSERIVHLKRHTACFAERDVTGKVVGENL